MNGKMKRYYENGNIEFEGDFINGLPIGQGKEYDENGNIILEGGISNGKENGSQNHDDKA